MDEFALPRFGLTLHENARGRPSSVYRHCFVVWVTDKRFPFIPAEEF